MTNMVGLHVSDADRDLDDEAMAEVLRRLGLTTKKDAVNEALRDYAAKLRRAAEFDGHIQRAQGWIRRLEGTAGLRLKELPMCPRG